MSEIVLLDQIEEIINTCNMKNKGLTKVEEKLGTSSPKLK